MTTGIDFDGSILFISARSPFARRVRLALREHGVSYEERVFDVFHPTAELIATNPLRRVPALVLRSGATLIDSHLILQTFYQSVESPLKPWTADDAIISAHWSGIAVGWCEKLVEYFLETQRPAGTQDTEVLSECAEIVEATLRLFNQEIGDREFVASLLTQADLDLGAALAYTSLRYRKDWEGKFPNASRYFRGLDARPSFEQTRPPSS
jgi:glutathione S-transferase